VGILALQRGEDVKEGFRLSTPQESPEDLRTNQYLESDSRKKSTKEQSETTRRCYSNWSRTRCVDHPSRLVVHPRWSWAHLMNPQIHPSHYFHYHRTYSDNSFLDVNRLCYQGFNSAKSNTSRTILTCLTMLEAAINPISRAHVPIAAMYGKLPSSAK
jgi:hypothetical protein